MSDLKEIGWFPKEWIVTRFTDLSPDEIQEMEEMAEKESGGEDEEGGGGGGGGLGGGGDMDMGGEEGGDLDMGDMGGEEGGEEGGGGEDMGGEELSGEEEDEAFELENKKEEHRIITEIRKDARRSKQYSNLVKLSQRANKPSNPFQFLLESKELDGLTKTPKNVLTEDKNDPGLLVEWSVPINDRREAMLEIRNVIKNQPTNITNDSDISQTDLPNIG
jgi:hypothetical protein